ncbi:MAG: YARHG domain-containing protein [Deltaproteobacteria bacterium]|nr:YARHG domain-containing protein [Deltaproteobacteria bacterium]
MNPRSLCLAPLTLALLACSASVHRAPTQAQSTQAAPAASVGALASAEPPVPPVPSGAQPGDVAGSQPAPTTVSPAQPTLPSAPANRPLTYAREITEADLAGRTLRELAIMRNAPYAALGHRFRRPWLADHFAEARAGRPLRTVQESELSALDRRNAQFIGRYDVALTRPQLELLADALRDRIARNRMDEGDNVEADLLSQRLGRRVALAPTRGVAQQVYDHTPLDDVSMLDSLLTRAQLLQMSVRDLWILRNMIYATRGRVFQSTTLNEYFASSAWYRPDEHYNDARLRRIDRQNLRLIQSVEAEMGGPTNATLDSTMYAA